MIVVMASSEDDISCEGENDEILVQCTAVGVWMLKYPYHRHQVSDRKKGIVLLCVCVYELFTYFFKRS